MATFSECVCYKMKLLVWQMRKNKNPKSRCITVPSKQNCEGSLL